MVTTTFIKMRTYVFIGIMVYDKNGKIYFSFWYEWSILVQGHFDRGINCSHLC